MSELVRQQTNCRVRSSQHVHARQQGLQRLRPARRVRAEGSQLPGHPVVLRKLETRRTHQRRQFCADRLQQRVRDGRSRPAQAARQVRA